jgi:hypothetical protein
VLCASWYHQVIIVMGWALMSLHPRLLDCHKQALQDGVEVIANSNCQTKASFTDSIEVFFKVIASDCVHLRATD